MIVFGPVPSRRLGQSLGINNIPPKICTYSCAYCQLGRTLKMEADRRAFYEPERVVSDVAGKVARTRQAGESIEYVTFSDSNTLFASARVPGGSGDHGQLLVRSTDGGETWELQPLEPMNILRIGFTSPEVGLIVGRRCYEDWVGPAYRARILRTTNGGGP